MSKIFKACLLEQFHGGSKKISIWIRSAYVSENGEDLEKYSISLCEALVGDIQTDDSSLYNIKEISKVLKGDSECHMWAGNSFTVTSDQCNTAFYNDATEEGKGEIPTYEYLGALLFWRKFLLNVNCPVEQVLPESNEEAISLLSDFFGLIK